MRRNRWFGPPTDEHIINDGTVWCPRLGLIDVDRCISCASLIGVTRVGEDVILECDPPRHLPGGSVTRFM